MRTFLILFTPLLFIYTFLSAQRIEVYPPHWWAGMKNNQIQLLIKGSDVNFNKAEVSINNKDIQLIEVHRLENGKYFALDIKIAHEATPATIDIAFKNGKKTLHANWSLRQRAQPFPFAQGITSSDFIYFLMPDRFSNGNPANDKIKGLRDQSLNRDSIFHRHGGDIEGIINHLDYLQELGVTTLWLTPVLQNDMPDRTEHGYAITDHYKIEPRFGGEEAYHKLSDELHKRKMKLIQDAVYNHVGLYHFFVQDKPAKDWLHEWPEYTNTTYKDQPLMDIHASVDDKERMSNGWFTPMMPDLNQRNPYVANFLIQHAVWCVEEFKLDGWRIDTYIYNDLDFMNRCNQALYDEYPNITMFGEAWVHGVLNQAYFTRNKLNVDFKSNLDGIADFQLNLYGIGNAVNEPFGWTNGVNRLYQTLANDFVYEDPKHNVLFLDNHDMTRFFSAVGEDIAKQKIGIAWLLTCRGIPQLYYGTEILMKGISNPDGWVRLDFPGGWPDDKNNKFISDGRSKDEEGVFQWTKKLANYRKTSSAIKSGKFMQYVPEDGVYVYFRYDNNETVMCIMNTNDKPMTIGVKRFKERISTFTKGIEITTDKVVDLHDQLIIPAKYEMVLQLK